VRTVYLGTSEFATDVLRVLAASAHRPVLVVTRPDRPKGRGRRVASPPVAELARELGLPVAQPASVNDEAARAEIAGFKPDAVCVCAFGALIKEPLLSDYEMLNVHPSLLPRWRGAAPVERAMMAGDADTGVSIMRVTAGLDSGPVCLRERVEIEPTDTYGTLAPRLSEVGGRLLVQALDGPRTYVEQPENGVTYADKITAEDRILDPSRNAAELERTVRALTPHIGARVQLDDGSYLGVGAASWASISPIWGGNLAQDDGRLLMRCADGALELERVQPPGGRMMAAADYLRGHAADQLRGRGA
jgi:methionyl-tRNA formyltransferase